MKEILNHSFFKDSKAKYEKFKEREQGHSLNVFTVSRYGTELENFHSDILKIILDPTERHGEKDFFIKVFIKYLNGHYNTKIDEGNYSEVKVLREKGRIDIWVIDEKSNRCVIIENKINGAQDMPDQLKRYYDFATKDSSLTVDAIVYLTLNEEQAAPRTGDKEIDNLLVDLVAVGRPKNDLYTHWIKKCTELIKERNEETFSFIFQYGVLLKHLSKLKENRTLQDEFYDLVSTKENYGKIDMMFDFFDRLHHYRAQLFSERLGDNYAPFVKKYKYKPWHWLYMGYQDENGVKYKLDVHFDRDYGRVDFWLNDDKVVSRPEKIANILNEIQQIEHFNTGGFNGGYYKEFNISDYNSLEEVDTELFKFVTQFLRALEKKDSENETVSLIL